jgi:hypothetical protein
MMFTVDSDTGDAIVGWVVPDNPNETPTLTVYLPDRDPIDIVATIARPDILDLGMHNTGMVGFLVGESLIPTLRDEIGLELRDTLSKTLIYKRFNPDRHLVKKLMYFDASVVPQRKCYRHINSNFAMNFNVAHSYPYETLDVIMRIYYSKSIFVAGRPYYLRYANSLKDKNFCVIALLRNPFEDLAERLLFLNLLARSRDAGELSAYAAGLMPLTDFASAFPFNDARGMDRAFRQAPKEIRNLLNDPLTRMLACNIDEPPKRNHVTLALDNLAGMNAVGTHDRFPDFKLMVAGVVGADIFQDSAPETFQTVKDLAGSLAKLGSVQNLLENDLALYSYVSEALENGLAATADAPA